MLLLKQMEQVYPLMWGRIKMTLGEKLKKLILGNPTKIVHVPISPESVQDSTQVKALAYENAELKGENAQLKGHIAKTKDRDTDRNEEENVKAVLNKEKNEIRLKSQGQVFSLKKFYAKFFRDKKFRDKLGIYSFDRSTRLANFGDFGIDDSGNFALFDDQGNMILRKDKLKDLMQSVGALGNDMARGMIPVNMDKEGSYIENIMIYEAPELIQTGDKLKFAKARKKPVYEIIQQLNDTIGHYASELEEAEGLNIALQNKIDKLTSENRVSDEMAETSRAELSHNEQRLTGIDKAFRTVQRDVFNLQNINAIGEDNIEKLESEIAEMREKAERQGVKLSDEKALELIQNIRATVVNELPDFQPQQTPQATSPQKS